MLYACRKRKEAVITGNSCNWIPSSQAPGSGGHHLPLQDSLYETFHEDVRPFAYRPTDPTPPINIEQYSTIDHYAVPSDSLQEYSKTVQEYEIPTQSANTLDTSFMNSGPGRTPPPSYSSIDEPPLPPRSPHQLQPSPYSTPISSHRESTDKASSQPQHSGNRVYFELDNAVVSQNSSAVNKQTEEANTEGQDIKNQNNPTYFVLEIDNPIIETDEIYTEAGDNCIDVTEL